MKTHFDTYTKPQTHTYIPDTYKNVWEEPTKFLPTKMQRSFNQHMFYNFIHRECFNSCLSKDNAKPNPNTQELTCYENCKNKHLSSMGIFESAVISKRKWGGLLSFINLKEYSKDPDEMGKLIPTDPFLRGTIRNYRAIKEQIYLHGSLNDIFDVEPQKPISIFEYYLFTPPMKGSSREKKDNMEKLGSYEHYKELSKKYGAVINDKLEKVDVKDWKGISGDDFEE